MARADEIITEMGRCLFRAFLADFVASVRAFSGLVRCFAAALSFLGEDMLLRAESLRSSVLKYRAFVGVGSSEGGRESSMFFFSKARCTTASQSRLSPR